MLTCFICRLCLAANRAQRQNFVSNLLSQRRKFGRSCHNGQQFVGCIDYRARRFQLLRQLYQQQLARGGDVDMRMHIGNDAPICAN